MHAEPSHAPAAAVDGWASADLQACVELMRGGSKTFFAASRLLPPRVRAPAIALYAFCRVADDLVDEAAAQGRDGAQGVAELMQRLDRIYAGTPVDCVEDHALSLVVQQHELPRPLLNALVDGFAWDAAQRRYETLEQVHDYAARVAGSVGAMMCWIMGPRERSTLARACELGVAMQLTNIARDVGEDAANGRLYLPRQWMREAGVDVPSWQAHPQASPAIQTVVARLLDEADRLYRRAHAGIAELPADCRAAICAASLIYAEIGHQLRRQGLDSVTRRTVVGTRRKLVLLASAWTQAGWIYAQPNPPAALAAVEFLLQGCAGDALAPEAAGAQGARGAQGASLQRGLSTATGFPNRAMPQRIEWVINLFERRESARLEWHDKRRSATARPAG
ncbi:MAG: phytoene/squalene synthase family protein [Burkholderiaceae bacterium]